jgi:hypothetical protein
MLYAVRLALITLATAIALPASLSYAAGEGRTPKPVIKIENADTKCVAPPEEMRRNHMEMLKHQRDETLREGIRGEPVSLNRCINCHASKQTGSVLGSNENFCQTCHAYVAVKLDCWDCHQPKANYKARVTNGAAPASHDKAASTMGAMK